MHRFKRYIEAVSVIAAAILATGCAGVSPYSDTSGTGGGHSGRSSVEPAARSQGPLHGPDARTASARRAIAALATKQVGVPYRYGGTDPREGFDCSGLVFYTYAESGIAVPRSSQELFKAASKISLDGAAEGDLVFFQDQQKLSHVGIYLGDGQFVHAPSSGRTVSISTLASPYYQRHLVAVGRLLPD